MKFLDKLIRQLRVTEALKHIPSHTTSVFDIGCDEGFLFKKLSGAVVRKVGVDPRNQGGDIAEGEQIFNGYFPQVVQDEHIDGTFDAIFALAVFEHFSEADIAASAIVIPNMLSAKGRLIVTLPHPFVDKILDALMMLRLIDGQATEEHHGFIPDDLVQAFASTLKLVKHQRFQFGLNNVFIFERA